MCRSFFLQESPSHTCMITKETRTQRWTWSCTVTVGDDGFHKNSVTQTATEPVRSRSPRPTPSRDPCLLRTRTTAPTSRSNKLKGFFVCKSLKVFCFVLFFLLAVLSKVCQGYLGLCYTNNWFSLKLAIFMPHQTCAQGCAAAGWQLIPSFLIILAGGYDIQL